MHSKVLLYFDTRTFSHISRYSHPYTLKMYQLTNILDIKMAQEIHYLPNKAIMKPFSGKKLKLKKL